jgi:hypothetical protein
MCASLLKKSWTAQTTSSLPSWLKVAHCESLGINPQVSGNRRLKGAVPIAQEHIDAPAQRVARNQIWNVVAVEVAHCNKGWGSVSGKGLRRLERAIGITQQYVNVGAETIRHHDIKIAVSIEIGNGQRLYGLTLVDNVVIRGWLKGSIASSKQNRDLACAGDRDCGVQFAIMIEVPCCDGERPPNHWRACAGFELGRRQGSKRHHARGQKQHPTRVL